MVLIQNQDAIRKALEQFKNVDNVNDYIILKYVDPNTITFHKHGKTVQSMVSDLVDGECAYILIRVEIKENDAGFKVGAMNNKSNFRDVFIAYTGTAVGIIEKGKKKSHVGDVKAVLQPHHAELSCVARANLNEASIKDKSAPLSGSHVID